MGLKQSVVIVNEFSCKTTNGGTRGGTPGNYVLRYMSRDNATETLTPVRKDTEYFIQRYMARESAVDNALSVDGLKRDMKDIDGLGGIAFGYGEISLSHKKLKAASRDIQKNFDLGKTVFKTVVSFEESYLKANHVIDEDFEFVKEGDYRGNIDQMRLRMAIMSGINKIANDYDDLQYVGVIQVDTKHIHCHLCMVDRGAGTLRPNGTQDGRLYPRQKKAIRRGIDLFLDEEKSVQMMASNVQMDKQNALCFVKKYTHKVLDENGLPQLLLACLPDNRNYWRANTNRKDMQRANSIVKDFVMDILGESDSGYSSALRSVKQYADSRLARDGLNEEEYKAIYQKGKDGIISDCINGVYSVLKRIPKEKFLVQTPMINAMTMDFNEANISNFSDPLIEFSFKLRSYSSRLNHHKEKANMYHSAVKSYENTQNRSVESNVVYDFFSFEETYNSMVMCKYQHFLAFLPPEKGINDEFDELMEYKYRLSRNKRMYNDTSIKKMKEENAEKYGRKVYDIGGGGYMVSNPAVIESRIQYMEQQYEQMEVEFRFRISNSGLSLDENGISRKKPYDFEDVKALDLHHLRYDFPNDFPISMRYCNQFISTADKRFDLFQGAKDYLVRSGQGASLSLLDEKDIIAMKRLADSLRTEPVVHTATLPVSGDGNLKHKKGKTIQIDIDYTKDMKNAVKDVLEAEINPEL